MTSPPSPAAARSEQRATGEDAARLRAAGGFAGDVLAATPGLVRDTHRAIAGRVFGAIGPAARPVQVVHDGVSAAVYLGVRGTSAAMPRLAGSVLGAVAAAGGPAPPATRAGRMAHGAVNGMWGDLLAERHPALALGMSLRIGGADLAPSRPALAAAYPAATGRLAFFVHGWCDNAESWQRYAFQRASEAPDATPVTVDYGAALQADLGITPVYVRYNTGLHISDNGRGLAELIDATLACWPVPVTDIHLVGHSMGGLVARSACHAGDQEEMAWTRLTRHVVCLGSPHLGAPLERGVNALSWALARIPETSGLARLINRRSRGVKDLRFGALAEADWRDADPDEFLRDRCTEVPFLPGAAYSFVGATVTRSPHSPLARLVGDTLVQWSSASGRGRRRVIPFDEERGAHFGGMHHLQLLNSPRVYRVLRDWLAASPVPPEPAWRRRPMNGAAWTTPERGTAPP